MKNTVLVNNSKTPGYVPFGFWYMSAKNAASVKYLASHDNTGIETIYEIGERFHVEMLSKLDAAGNELPKDRKNMKKWVFRLTALGGVAQAQAKIQLKDVTLKGVQGVIYSNVKL